MSYASLAEYQAKYPATETAQLTDDVAGAMADTVLLQEALDTASRRLDGAMAQRYPLPLASPYPQGLLDRCADIARLWLHYRRSPLDENVLRWGKAIDAMLERIANGTEDLGLTASGDGLSTAPGVDYAGPDRVFTDDAMARY